MRLSLWEQKNNFSVSPRVSRTVFFQQPHANAFESIQSPRFSERCSGNVYKRSPHAPWVKKVKKPQKQNFRLFFFSSFSSYRQIRIKYYYVRFFSLSSRSLFFSLERKRLVESNKKKCLRVVQKKQDKTRQSVRGTALWLILLCAYNKANYDYISLIRFLLFFHVPLCSALF